MGSKDGLWMRGYGWLRPVGGGDRGRTGSGVDADRRTGVTGCGRSRARELGSGGGGLRTGVG